MTHSAGVAELISSPAVGLGAHAVEVVGYNPAWPALYDAVERDLVAALEFVPCAIAHIGSTSVPGLAAKPVIDIAVGATAPVDAPSFRSRLEPLGFVFQADLGIYGGLLYTVTSEARVVSNLHIVDIDDFQWRWYLAFRDGLRSDPALRDQYAALKREGAGESRDAYNKAKFDWVLATASGLAGDDLPQL